MNNRELHIDKLINGFRIGKKQVVLQDQISAAFGQGEFICLLGPNGAGKSTLLRTLSGFQKPLSGRILFSGKELNLMSLKERAKEVAVVLTGQISDPYLTAFEVVSMGRFPYASFYGGLNQSDIDLVKQTLKTLHVYHLKDKLFQQLSDGEKQKMLLARALVQNTPFLFLDEPVAFVDSPGKIEIMEWLLHFAHEQKKGILITTHDIELALDYADKFWLMNRDKPFQSGIPEDLVLNGIVNSYFDRGQVKFDPQKGRFAMHKKSPESPVYLKGDQLEMQWLCRALSRKGKDVQKLNPDHSPDHYFSFNGNQFVLKQKKGSELYFNTIEEVLLHI